MKINSLLAGVALMATSYTVCAQDNTVTVQTKKIGADIQPTMYGVFFEDINFGADGGLYAELVKNRSFEFAPDHYMGWKMFGNVTLQNDGPFDKNPHYVRLGYAGHGDMWTGIQNEGFFGIGLKKDAEYRFSVWARVPDGKPVTLMVQFIDQNTMDDAQQFVSQDLVIDSKEWKKYTMVMKSNRTIAKANLRIFLSNPQHRSGTGTVDLEHVSLFPVDTWMGHENGMRKDLAQALYDMRPGVFRFPGGCIVEGSNLETRYQWKHTVGPVENRPLNKNRWESTFTNRYYPDYFQSYGLGFYEYFLLSEEIGAAPLPVLNVGMACQYQNWDNEKAHAACNAEDLKPYIDDALDLIEFANGSTDTKWGKLRADMGHPEPFNMKYLGIGNEQWDKFYFDRLKFFVEAVRKAHPEILIIGSSGPDSEGKMFDLGWEDMKKQKVDLVDEHFYRPVDWFKNSMNRYFRGQTLVALCVGVLFSIGFLIIDLPLAIIMGMFIGLLNMVPYLQLISLLPTTLLCVVYAAETNSSFWVIFALAMVVYGVVQLIQDLYLVPKIMGKTMGLNPAIILLSLSIWGSLLGFLGLIIALPLTTLLLSYYNTYVLHEGKPEESAENQNIGN